MKKYILVKPFADTKKNKKIVTNSNYLSALSQERIEELMQKGFVKVEEVKTTTKKIENTEDNKNQE